MSEAVRNLAFVLSDAERAMLTLAHREPKTIEKVRSIIAGYQRTIDAGGFLPRALIAALDVEMEVMGFKPDPTTGKYVRFR